MVLQKILVLWEFRITFEKYWVSVQSTTMGLKSQRISNMENIMNNILQYMLDEFKMKYF